MYYYFFRPIYPVGKLFFLIQTKDHAKYYGPENKIVIDIQAGVKFFEDRVGILKHVEELTQELCNNWNDTYLDRPQVTTLRVLLIEKLCFCNSKN